MSNSLFAVIIYFFLMAASPGPNNLTCMLLGKELKFKESQYFVYGAVLGLAILRIIIGFFTHFVIAIYAKIAIVFAILGALYLIYLAFIILFSTKLKAKNSITNLSRGSLFTRGVLLQIVNMKAIIAMMTFFSIFAPIVTVSESVILIAVVLMAIGNFLLMVGWLYIGYFVYTLFKNKYFHLAFNIIMAGFLFYIAIMILLDTIKL